jgi:hypothetical protein
MDFANGTKLHAALPVFRAGRIDHYVVLVERPSGARDLWVTATVVTLDDTSWSHGNYFTDRDNAVSDVYVRAGIVDLVTLDGVADTMRVKALDRV